MKSKVKKIASMIIIFAMSFNSFAAVVSDNDGSSFITKAEFDSLKNNFQSTINAYNTNIDSKIDTAIAAYLAGVNISNEFILRSPVSILKYPVTLYNYENKYTVADFPTLTGDTKWWGPDIQLWMAYGWALRTNVGYSPAIYDSHFDVLKAKYVRGTKNKINDFYNIETHDSSKGKVSGMTKNLKCTNVITALEHTKNSWNPQDKDYGYILREDQSDRTNFSGVTSGTFGNIYANGAQLNKSNVVFNTLLMPYIIVKGALPTYTGTGDALYEKFTITAGNGVWNNGPNKAILQGWNKNVISNTYDFVNEISKIYTGYPKNGEDELVPVSYENIVYYENYKHYKQDLCPYFTDTQAYSIKDNNNDSTNYVPKISSYIDNGWTINPEGSSAICNAATRPWYNRSLVRINHLYYEVTLPYTSGVLEQRMTQGILFAEIDESGMLMDIELDISMENVTNDKYLVISKSPIRPYDPSFSPDANYLNIYDNKYLSGTGTQKFKITAGKKNYYINLEKDGIKTGDVLYYKILWGPDDNSYVKINSAPIVKITTSD